MGKGRTLIRGVLMLAASGLMLRGLGVLFQSFLAGRIGAEGMGLLQLVLTVGGFAGTLASSGVRVAALQMTAAAFGRGDRHDLSAAVGGCLRYGLIVSGTVGLGLILLAEPIAGRLLLDRRTVPALRTLGLLLPFPTLCGVLRGVFTACGRVRELVAVEAPERILGVGLTILLLRFAGDLPEICAAVIAGSFGSSLFSVTVLLVRLRRSVRRCGKPPLGPVIRLCVPLALNDYLRAGLSAVEQFLIPWGLSRSGSRSSALSAYGRISGMVFPVLWFPSELVFALAELMVSELARCQARGEAERLLGLVRKCLRAVAGFAGTVFLVLYTLGGPLGRFLFRSAEVGYELRVFAPMVLFLYPDAIVDGLQKGLGQQLYLVRYNSLTNVIDVVGLFTLLPRFGIAGYLFTYCLSHLVNLFLSLRRLLVILPEGGGQEEKRPSGAAAGRLTQDAKPAIRT